MTMILTSTPDPEQVLADLQDVTAAIWDALEAGVQHAREYFDSRGLDVDPFVAADLTRFEAKRLLEQQQHEAEFERRELSNNGLRVLATRNGRLYDLRIRRADGGLLPTVQSDAMAAFYYQPVLEGIELAHAESINLVILWETPSNYSQITAMNMACPRAGGEYREDVHAHWYTPIPHPVTTTSLPIEVEQAMADEQPIVELPIELLPEQQTGTESDNGEDE